MRIFSRSVFIYIIQYLLVILVVAATTILLWILREFLSLRVIGLMYLLPVVLSARLWGLGPGILTALSSFLSLNYFFTPPLYTFVVHNPQDLLALFVFLIVAIVISQLLAQDQKSIAAATAREREATQLYELNLALGGLQDNQSIAQTLAEKIRETFFCERVEVVLNNSEGDSIICASPDALIAPQKEPDLIVPLITTREQQGIVNIWRNASPFSKSEKRLLSTITGQGALAIDRAKLVQAENRAKVLEESDHLKSTLLSLVSHELRSPLVTIKASISSLNSGTIDWDSEARRELLEAVEEETDVLNQLVGNLLDMSRIEIGALKPQKKWNSLAEIVNGVVKRMHRFIRHHHVIIDIPDDLPLVPVDYVQIEQVFTNLLSNSAKYSPPDSVIRIQAHLLPDQMVLTQISNQGPHVAEESLDRIFDKFYRVTAADKVTGTGLGLSICKGIIEAHGGRIWAENARDSFIFCFTLPITWDGALPRYPEEV